MTFAIAVFAVSLAAAAVTGWGWGIFGVPAKDQGAHALALMAGQVSAIGLLVASGFALPVSWRRSDRAGPLLMAQAGVMLIAGAAGMAVALTAAAGPGSSLPMVPVIIGGLGAALVLAAVLMRAGSGRRAAARAEMIRAGRQAPGVVTQAAQTGMVNNVPRWRVVVRFTDEAGADRWVTKHTTTYRPPGVGRQAVVYYDPARPGDQRHMVVSW